MRALRVPLVPALLAVALLTVAGLGLRAWLTSDTRRIESRLDRLRELVDKDPGESRLEALARAHAIADLFASRFEVRAEPVGFSTRDRQTLTGGIARYRSLSERIRMRLQDTRLWIDSDRRRATSTVTYVFVAGPSLLDRDAYRFQFNWIQERGEWRIDFAQLLEILQ